MSKIYKCVYCKKPIENDLIEFEQGIKKKVKKRAHQECRKEVLYKNEFYDKLFKLLEIRPLKDNNFYVIVNKMISNYSWEIAFHALNYKTKDIKKNAHMPIPYILKIISNQIPFSERDVKKEKEIKKKQKEIKQIKEQQKLQEEEIIIVKSKPKEKTQVVQCEDISNL